MNSCEIVYHTTYENMKSDLRKVATDLLAFLKGKNATIDMDTLLAQLDIEAFRKNKFVNKEQEIPPDKDGNTFIRKGIIGDWKNYFDEEMNKEWEYLIMIIRYAYRLYFIHASIT